MTRAEEVPPSAEVFGFALGQVAEAGRRAAAIIGEGFAEVLDSVRAGLAAYRAHLEAEEEARLRRIRLAEFDASDPVGRLAEFGRELDRDARELADRYGFDWPPPRTLFFNADAVTVEWPGDHPPRVLGTRYVNPPRFEHFTIDVD